MNVYVAINSERQNNPLISSEVSLHRGRATIMI